jgi:hypothetical protein
MYACSGPECLCDIRLERLCVERLMSLALYIVIILMIFHSHVVINVSNPNQDLKH